MDCGSQKLSELILSENAYDIITDYPLEGLVQDGSLCYVQVEGNYNIVYVDSPGLARREVTLPDYQNVPKLYGLMQLSPGQAAFDPGNLITSGITQVQGPPLNLTGRGVVVCVIDTGIDYTNGAFRDENGNSRILAIWDQTEQNGTPPSGFYYGSEYRREQINAALQAENPYEIVPTRDELRHGSAMAGVAAGSNVRIGRQYLGAAPEAYIVVVKLKQCKEYLRRLYLVPENVPAYQENDIMLGIKYADSFAETFDRPVVICLGLGTNLGDHTGSSALSRYLDLIALKRSRAVVVTGGNEGNAAHHFEGQLETREPSRDVEVRVGENALGFWLEFWGSLPDTINVSVRTPGGEMLQPVSLGLRQSITYSFVYEKSRVTVSGSRVEGSSGEQVLLFRISEPTEGIWTFRVQGVGQIFNGRFHAWLPVTEFLNTQVYFLSPTPYVTLTEPSMAAEILSVTTYNGENDSFYIESGRGFDRRGAVRPDLAAPGVNVSTIYGRSTGGSLSAAIAAGAAAQFMQWAIVDGNDIFINGRQLKTFLIRGADRDETLTYPNREWGYGRLNLEQAFRVMTEM